MNWKMCPSLEVESGIDFQRLHQVLVLLGMKGLPGGCHRLEGSHGGPVRWESGRC